MTVPQQQLVSGLVLRDVAISLRQQRLLKISVSVGRGEITTITGTSGAGKSTLLSYVCGMLGPEFTATGDVLVDGRLLNSLPPQKRDIGILFQDDLLFPHLSVAGNLNFAIKPAIRPRRLRRERIARALDAAGLAGFEERDPATLSGGQRARIALMRVLLSEPRVLLMDEPFSKLDTDTRSQFREFVFSQIRLQQLPTLLVTHDAGDADAAGGKVLAI